MPLPRAVARFNKRWTNCFVEPLARRSPGFAVVHHRGRTSGARYSTPINAFRQDDTVIVALTYGPSTDWFRNIQAGPAELEVHQTRSPIVGVELLRRHEAASALPTAVRLTTRLLGVKDFAAIQLGSRT